MVALDNAAWKIYAQENNAQTFDEIIPAEFKEAFGLEAELTNGSNGAFEVIVNDITVFSKLQTGRFPEQGEVVEALKKQMGK